MNIPRHLVAIAAGLLATTAWAQTTGKPLNLKLPPGDLPAATSTAPKPAAPKKTTSDAPGVYYGDTSGRMGNTEPVAEVPDCDDATYDQPQVHGSVGMGVMGGSHTSGNYQSGTVSVSKNLGDCDHPRGGVSFSIGVDQGHFHGRGR